MKNLQGKRALLTGASRGIGIHIAQALVASGAELILTARSDKELNDVATRLRQEGAKVEVIVSDMADLASLERLVKAATAHQRPIDILVNNAGIYAYGVFGDASFDAIQKMIQVNLTGLMYLTHALLPDMRKRDQGHVVNISSLAGLAGSAYSEPYCATKHAVVGFTRALRASLKQDRSRASASVICPGIVDETGIFEKLSVQEGVQAPALMGKSNPRHVADAVIRCIVKDLPEVIVNPSPMRPGLVLTTLFPAFMEWLSIKLGLHGFLPPGQDT